ncbi:hypothetical protein M9H77_21111 [Catharanthus roseus]|uniref:Uncharacterized protein n=1 Tax=Catharanthus roseus TaxID=4058 RepID=A0ACC0APB4_CATRO|nr:hypothetical protein M9H77_21111 [Catharanthus roseus]
MGFPRSHPFPFAFVPLAGPFPKLEDESFVGYLRDVDGFLLWFLSRHLRRKFWYLYFVMLTCRMKHKQSKANTILPFSDHNDLLTTRVFELRTVQGLLGIMTV